MPGLARADSNKPPEPPGQAKKHHNPGVTIPDLVPRPTLDKKLPPGTNTGPTDLSPDPSKTDSQNAAKAATGGDSKGADESSVAKHRAAEATGIAAAKKAGKPTAVPDLTTESSTTVANPDGSLTATIAPGPVRTAINGTWQPIDTTLTKSSDGSLKPKAATAQIMLSNGGDGPLASVALGGKKTTVTWPLGPLPTPQVDGGNATYPQVLPGVDLRVTATADGIREVLVVSDAKAAANPALRTLRFGITGDGLTIKATDGGGLSAVDEQGRQVFTGPVPQMWDSSGTDQDVAGSSAIAAVGSGALSAADGPRRGAKSAVMPLKIAGGDASLVPDQSLLTDPGTKYPVFIDPTINGANYQCVQIYKGNPSLSANCDSYMRAGYDPVAGSVGAVRSLFSFDVVNPLTTNNPYNSIPGSTVTNDPSANYDNITSATLKLSVHSAPSCGFNGFRIYRTGPIGGPVTWANAVTDNTNGIWGQMAILLNPNSAISASSCADGATLSIDDTAQVQSIFANQYDSPNPSPYATLGVRLDQENNTSATYWSFYSQTAALTITYRSTPYVAYDATHSISTTPPIVFNGPVSGTPNCRNELNNAAGVQSLPEYGGPPSTIGYISKNFGNQITLHADIGNVDPVTVNGQFQFADVTNVQPQEGINFGQVIPASGFYQVNAGGPAGTTDPGSIVLGSMTSTPITQNNTLYPLIDGHTYRYSTYVFDPAIGDAFTEETEACYFKVAFKAPKAPSETDPGDFPGLGYSSKSGMSATKAGAGITFNVDTDGVNIDHFEYVINDDPSTIPSTQSGYSCTRTNTRGCLSAAPTSSGNVGVGATATVPIPAGVTTMGTNTVWIRAVDLAGNVSPVGVYQFYLPGTTGAVAALGDITGDGVPDVLSVEPDTNNNARLLTFPGNTDPNLLGSNVHNAVEAAPATAAPDGASWANTLVTHRGALRGIAVDDMFAYSKTNQSLYYYLNSNVFGGTVNTDMYALNHKVLVTRPPCTPSTANRYCAGGAYSPDWSHVTQILAFGNVAGNKPGNFAGRTNLITVEDDGNHGGSVWMFSAGSGLGQLTNPVLLSTDNSKFNWLDTDLITPGVNPGGSLPNLWARDRTTGNLWQITNTYDRNGVEDPTSLGNMANAATIGAQGGYGKDTLIAAGNPSSAGSVAQTGYPALWDIESNGTLRMLPGSANGPITPINNSWPSTRNSWTNVNNISSVDGSPVTTPAGSIALGEGQTSGNPQLCIDLQDPAANAKTIVWNYTCNGQVTQSWVINSDGTIQYAADRGKCLEIALDVPGYRVLTPDQTADGNYGANAGTMNHAPVQLNACTLVNGLPAANQQWVLRPSAGAASNGLHGWYNIYNPNSARCLANGGDTTNTQQQLWIYDCNDGQAQQFKAPAAAGTWMYVSAGTIAPWGTHATAPTSVNGDTYTLNGTIGSSYGLNWYVPYEGDFYIMSAINTGPGNGTMQVSVDGSQSLPFTVDGYAPQAGTAQAYYGARHLTVGNHSFVFTVSGKNSAASGYQLALNNLIIGPSHGVGPASSLQITGPANPQLIVPATVGFDATKSYPGLAQISSYTFDFGDGTPVSTGTTATASHTYTSGGDYTAKVTVTDTAGGTATSTQVLTITPATPGTLASSDGTTTTPCATSAATAPTSASLTPTLSATVATGLSAQFEIRDLTDPSTGPPIAIGDANSTGSTGPTSALTTPALTNGHEYAFAARTTDGAGIVSPVSATCYLWAIISGAKATPTGAVSLPLDNTSYPAGSPQTWTGPKSTLKWVNGNLALYRNGDNTLLWGAVSGTSNNVLVLQNDGNVAIYGAPPSVTSTGTVNGNPLWSTNVAGQGVNALLLAADGSLSLRSGTTPLWTAPQPHDWTLNDGQGTAASDRSLDNPLPATVSGGASLASSGYALLDGSTGYLATAAAAIDTTKSFTVSAWVYINSLANYQTFVTQQGSQSGGFHLEFQNNGASGNVWSFGRATTDAANAGFVRANSSAGSPKTDTWTHLIASWDAATGAMTLYVNGQVVGTATDTTPIASTGPLVIGRGFYNGAANNYVGGGIADVRAYQQSFSAGLANELYQKTGFTPPTSLTFPLSTPTALTSSDGAPVACNTDPAHPAVSTTLTPSLGATLANAAWRADFEMRDVTDPSAATPLYYRGANSTTSAGTAVSLATPQLTNGHEYAFAARSDSTTGAKSATTASCYLRIAAGGQTATPATGAVGTFLDGAVYPASAGPITWSGPQSTLTWQTDGNLVLKKNGQAVWASDTAGNPGATLALQQDGNLVIRAGMPLMDATGTLFGSSIWSTGTTSKNAFTLVVQTDGSVTLNGGSGPLYNLMDAPGSISGTMADFNHDGKIDLVAVDPNDVLYLYPGTGGTGTNTFGTRVQIGSGFSTTLTQDDLLVGDVNGDTYPDLVVVNSGTGDLVMFPGTNGTGANTFGPSVLLGVGWGSNWRHLMLGDVNGDGKADLLGFASDGGLYAYPSTGGTGTGTFGSSVLVGSGWSTSWTHMMLGDITRDGKADLLAVDSTTGNLYLYPSTGGIGTIAFGASSQVGSAWAGMTQLNLGDVTGDQRLDIVAVAADGNMYAYPGTGGSGLGTFGNAILIGSGWSNMRSGF
ncbi:hypothetical protein GCM10009839_32980 [Catenulispora yoronensis]|uniref:PKD domain-containing protein n=2 Tax=Catenulispora yoronensis TaxID=450799 RepID=A0ABP5FRQ4_9ACTN